jgi:hypothetical protein
MRRLAFAPVLMAVVVAAACASGAGSSNPSAPAPAANAPGRNPNRISTAELEGAGVGDRTLYDAIAQLRPNWLRSRGATSFRDGGAGNLPAVMVDNVRQSGETTNNLRMLKVQDTLEAQFVSSSDATTQYGTGYPNGLIRITTRRGR